MLNNSHYVDFILPKEAALSWIRENEDKVSLFNIVLNDEERKAYFYVELAGGFCFGEDGEHSKTILSEEMVEELQTIRRCECEECKDTLISQISLEAVRKALEDRDHLVGVVENYIYTSRELLAYFYAKFPTQASKTIEEWLIGDEREFDAEMLEASQMQKPEGEPWIELDGSAKINGNTILITGFNSPDFGRYDLRIVKDKDAMTFKGYCAETDMEPKVELTVKSEDCLMFEWTETQTHRISIWLGDYKEDSE